MASEGEVEFGERLGAVGGGEMAGKVFEAGVLVLEGAGGVLDAAAGRGGAGRMGSFGETEELADPFAQLGVHDWDREWMAL